MALLVQRAVVGASVLVEAVNYLLGNRMATAGGFTGLVGLAAGVMLTVGSFTPFAGVVVAIMGLAVSLSMLPASVPTLFSTPEAIIFSVPLLLAVIVLGPGAYSVDARLFGRRTIIIPPVCRPS